MALPLAQIRRDGAGRFVYDPEYVPPCLQIGANDGSCGSAGDCWRSSKRRAPQWKQERRSGRKELREFASHEVANFWLLHAVRSSMVPLRHYLDSARSPGAALRQFARLAGALCTFALDSDPRALPLYDHEQLGECFAALDRHIRQHLEIIVPTNCLSIPLRQVSDFLFVGSVPDQRCFGRAQWIYRGAVGDRPGRPDRKGA